MRIEDYALIGDTQTAALVGRDGSIDWLCLPRFDSAACFAALLGSREHGHWSLAPRGVRRVERRYRPGSLVLETTFWTETGAVRLVDAMPVRQVVPDLVRMVEGVDGTVEIDMELVVRFDYGSRVPWVRSVEGRWTAVAGPDAIVLDTPAPLHGEDLTTTSRFTVRAGDRVPFVLSWHPSCEPPPPRLDAAAALEETEAWWTAWSSRADGEIADPRWRAASERSLITLKALTHAPTGGIVAAPTTSLPEHLGGVRNWDYRFCWLRDATFTLYSLLLAGYTAEALAWRDWMLRAVGGDPATVQMLYGPGGECRLAESVLGHLPGYEGSGPVRIGNAACQQFQLDVYGEVLDAMHQARRAGLPYDEHFWNLEKALVSYIEDNWRRPDSGIWEIRGEPRRFTHSKVMAWVGLDRAVQAAECFGAPGPIEQWRACRDEIYADACRTGYDAARGTFVQHEDTTEVDAALLTLPLVGFVAADDPRMQGTVRAIERDLVVDGGFVLRYRTDPSLDGLPPGEGCFLSCTLWLADNYALAGRHSEAVAAFERVLDVANDVGLLAEEYDPVARRQLGNFPQAFSHVGVVNTARNLSGASLTAVAQRSAARGSPPVASPAG